MEPTITITVTPNERLDILMGLQARMIEMERIALVSSPNTATYFNDQKESASRLYWRLFNEGRE